AVPVKIGAADIPTLALGSRAEDKRSFGRAYEQKHVAFSDQNMLHAVQDHRPGLLDRGLGGENRSRVNRFESGLRFSRPLISLRGLLGQTALNDSPQAGR